MRDLEEIKKTSGLVIKKEGKDVLAGTVFPIEYRNGKAKEQEDMQKIKEYADKMARW